MNYFSRGAGVATDTADRLLIFQQLLRFKQLLLTTCSLGSKLCATLYSKMRKRIALSIGPTAAGSRLYAKKSRYPSTTPISGTLIAVAELGIPPIRYEEQDE